MTILYVVMAHHWNRDNHSRHEWVIKAYRNKAIADQVVDRVKVAAKLRYDPEVDQGVYHFYAPEFVDESELPSEMVTDEWRARHAVNKILFNDLVVIEVACDMTE